MCHHNYNISFIRSFGNASFTCPHNFSIAEFNYPSIIVLNLTDSTTATRRVKNVGTPGTYKVNVLPPPGISVVVEPKRLPFAKLGEEKVYNVTFKPSVNGTKRTDYVYGELIWSDKKHKVKTLLVVKLQ